MNKIRKSIFAIAATVLTMGMSSCVGDLDVTPIDPNMNDASKIKPEQLFNKCYAFMAFAGNENGDSDPDISDIDGGTQGFLRQIFNANELTTDEAICGWGDEGIAPFIYNSYDASHPMLNGLYYRLYFGVTCCNQYLQEFGNYDATMTAEVRFVRALTYYELMDIWGNVPFRTEITSGSPQQIKRADLWKWLEKELLEIEPLMSAPEAKTSTNKNYGRADKAAVWMLLARLYLNSQVYTGTPHYTEAATYAKKVIDSPYRLYTTPTGNYPAYQKLFMGDNGESGASVEAILPILQGTSSQYKTGTFTWSFGCTLYLIAATSGDKMFNDPNNPSAINGTNGHWAGVRARSQLLAKFFPNNDAPNVRAYNMISAAGDDRALFDGVDRTLKIIAKDDVADFNKGFGVYKFTNIKSDGTGGSHDAYPDTDFFLLRAAEAYLIYAEATARTNGGSTTTEGTAYINQLRTRAHAATYRGYSLNDICDEWSREFFFEGLRRPTLIRFGKFGGASDYVWDWKGGIANGRNFDAYRNLFALPTSDMNVNKNLVQNAGYAN